MYFRYALPDKSDSSPKNDPSNKLVMTLPSDSTTQTTPTRIMNKCLPSSKGIFVSNLKID